MLTHIDLRILLLYTPTQRKPVMFASKRQKVLVNKYCALSSVGQSIGFLNRGSQVRILQGAPNKISIDSLFQVLHKRLYSNLFLSLSLASLDSYIKSNPNLLAILNSAQVDSFYIVLHRLVPLLNQRKVRFKFHL